MKNFPKEELQALVYDSSTTLKVVRREIADTSRWSIHYEMIFQDTSDGNLYETSYSEGATERQCEEPFEYEPDVIPCEQVEPYEKVVTDYRVIAP